MVNLILLAAGKRLVGRVVDHLLQDVQGVVGARIHAGRCLTGSRPLRTRIEPSEYSLDGLTAMGADCSGLSDESWINSQLFTPNTLAQSPNICLGNVFLPGLYREKTIKR
jgi:hypothetical protein